MLATEARNEYSRHIDKMGTLEMLSLIHKENQRVQSAVEAALPRIAEAVDAISAAFARGGRLFYIGAGTSGRLGVLDASECPPTFGVPYDKVIGIIAGGDTALRRAAENAEDSSEAAKNDLASYVLSDKDVLVGISAAGGAKYVIGGLAYAKECGATTVAVTSNVGTAIGKLADMEIVTETGAEVITGSTRLKAGTAQKIVLNMLSTAAMVKCGYVYENLMINLKPSNEKLRDRMARIVSDIKEIPYADAQALLEESDFKIRAAIEK